MRVRQEVQEVLRPGVGVIVTLTSIRRSVAPVSPALRRLTCQTRMKTCSSSLNDLVTSLHRHSHSPEKGRTSQISLKLSSSGE